MKVHAVGTDKSAEYGMGFYFVGAAAAEEKKGE